MVRRLRALSRGTFTALLALVLAAALAACGGEKSGDTGAAASAPSNKFTSETVAQQVAVAADPSGGLKWDKTAYTATAGDVSFVVTNKSPLPHQFAVEGNGVNVQSANFNANTTNTFTLKGLKAGEYTIVCNYPGHKDSGMVSKLTVK